MLKKILFVVFALSFQCNVFACMCIPPTVEKEWEYSSHIFTGKILSIQQHPSIYMASGDNKREYILIEIQQSFKGFYTVPKYITLIKINDSCQRNYLINSSYIFYCSTFMGTEIMYAPDICSRTMSSANTEFTDEIKALTELKNTKPPPTNSFSIQSIETSELNNLRSDAAQSNKLTKENKTLKIIIISLSILVIFAGFYLRLKILKQNKKI
ncbi:hypothetical protein [Flavobacterium tegetincola]|uniref:hypothetical protein n=1 Tax=Flavobacterium tegetincola TaxID=150172 RepID=UPI00040F0D3F|nr:hypothetical protein [Flavobacterium tegetincola]